MTIIHPIDNFLYTLFPNIEKNQNSLENALTEFYSVGNIKPLIEFKDRFVKITIDYLKIETENKQFTKLISLCESSNFGEAKILADKLIELNPDYQLRIEIEINQNLRN